MRLRTMMEAVLAGSMGVAMACSDPVGPRPPIEQLPRTLSVDEQRILRASNEFAFDLLRDVYVREDHSPNVVLSPLSISMALGMTMNGTAGATYDEMRAMLGFEDMPRDAVNHAYRDLMDLLLGLDPAIEITIANSTWARTGFPLLPSFEEAVLTFFDAEAHVLDFSSPDAPGTINGWVEEKTRGRIDTIIDGIDPEAMMFLINVVYFKGSWRTQFDPAETRESTFHLDGGGSVQVPMMHAAQVELRWGADAGVTVAELPYGGDAFTMVLVLPPEGTSLADFVGTVDAATWDRWMESLHAERNGDVALPRFEIEYERVLNKTLQALGMQQAFIPFAADFSMLSARDGLFVEDVRHKTFLRVDEEGTEAAAVTSVEVDLVSAPPRIRVDRPFLLAIRERHSGTILFIGAIGDPR